MNRRILPILALAVSALLAGCAGMTAVESDVQAFSKLPAVPPDTSYRFERLPSQQSHGEQQAQLEKIAEQALAKVGLRRDEKAAKYSVQVGGLTQRDPRAPWDEMWPGWGLVGRDYVVGANGLGMWTSPFPRVDSPYYRRELGLLLRDLSTNQVVFETHAHHEGRWADSTAVLPAMFDAALKGFPQPPQGMQKIKMEVQVGADSAKPEPKR